MVPWIFVHRHRQRLRDANGNANQYLLVLFIQNPEGILLTWVELHFGTMIGKIGEKGQSRKNQIRKPSPTSHVSSRAKTNEAKV